MNTDQDLKLVKHYYNRLTPLQKQYIYLLVIWRAHNLSAWLFIGIFVYAFFRLVTPMPLTYKKQAHYIKPS